MNDTLEELLPYVDRIAEQYPDVFRERYPFWKESLHTVEAAQMMFVRHIANDLWNQAEEAEKTDPRKAGGLYQEASRIYGQHIKIGGYLATQGNLNFLNETSFDLARMTECSNRITKLEKI